MWRILRAVSVNLRKSDKPVFKVCENKNDLGKFVRIKSIHDGLSWFLKHVESLIKLSRWYVPQ